MHSITNYDSWIDILKTICSGQPNPISEMAPTIEAGNTNLSNFDKKYIAKTADSSSKSNKKSNTNEAYLRTKYYVGFSKGLYDTKYFHEAYQGPTTSGKFVQSRKNNLKEEKNK
jgi:hypothetical protein